jgi:cobalt/nickel transport system ATP-binding protein
MADTVLQVQDLSFRYDDGTEALRSVNFRLEKGECVALLGANGSGKTTFILNLNGLLSGKGRIEVCGMTLTKENLPAIRSKVGIVFQDADEQLFMPTVLEDVAFGPANLGLSPEDAVAAAKDALDKVAMLGAIEKSPYHLSAGEKRRVALAGILAMNPEILILDEPTTFLDPPGQRNLLHLLQTLPQAKLIVTHDAAFAAALTQRAVFFEQGRIIEDGPIASIVDKYKWGYSFLAPDDLRNSAQRRF